MNNDVVFLRLAALASLTCAAFTAQAASRTDWSVSPLLQTRLIGEEFALGS